MAIPDYVIDALSDALYDYINFEDLTRDQVLDEVEAVDADAADWLESNPDVYDEAVRIALEES